MGTITNFGKGRRLWATAGFFLCISRLFGQVLEYTSDAGVVTFTVKAFPNLEHLPSTSEFASFDPAYEIYADYGDGNRERISVASSGHKGTTYSFADKTWTHTYADEAQFMPGISLTAKYTPPDPLRRELLTNPDGTSSPGAGAYLMLGSIRSGRHIGVEANHHIGQEQGGLTTLGIGWNRAALSSSNNYQMALFYGATRTTDAAATLVKSIPSGSSGNSSIMGMVWKNAPHANLDQFSGDVQNDRTEALFPGVMANFYDSVLLVPNLNTNPSLEGRYFATLRNQQNLNFTGRVVSVFGVVTSSTPQIDTDSLAKLGPDYSTRLTALGLTKVTIGGRDFLRLDSGSNARYVVDWFFFEEMPEFIHDPNEIIIREMKKNPTTGVFDMRLTFTSCNDRGATGVPANCTVSFDRTDIDGLVLFAAEKNGIELDRVEIGAPPPGTLYHMQIDGINLKAGECFTMHLKGTLPLAKEHLAYEDGQLLHGCVMFKGESLPNSPDLCCANLPFDTALIREFVPPVPPGPCNRPGLWNYIKCLCEKSPLPCWLIALLVLLLLAWLFFKKKK